MITDGRLRGCGQGTAWDATLGGVPASGTEPFGRGVEVDAGVVGTGAIRKGGPGRRILPFYFPRSAFKRPDYSFMFNTITTLIVIGISLFPPHSPH